MYQISIEPINRKVYGVALCFLFSQHDNNIIHRDLKAENVLYTRSMCVKVADFGFSTRIKNHTQMLSTFCGSPQYAAPELFRDEPYNGPPVDIWAMGVLLFFMVTGTIPFRADTIPKLRRCVLQGLYALPVWVSAPCRRLIQGILQLDPAKRCTVDQMCGCEWLLPVEILRPGLPLSQLNLAYLMTGGMQPMLGEVQETLQELGVTREHIVNNQGKKVRSPITGMYRIILHRVQRDRGSERTPMINGVVKDPKRDSFRTYRNLRHTSKLCVVS